MKQIDYGALDAQYGPKIPHRIAAYEKALTLYKTIVEQRLTDIRISYREEMATMMGYFAYHCNDVCAKPFIQGLSDRYKIASMTELAIALYQPLTSDSNRVDTQMLNAQFAVYCAFNIMENFVDRAGVDDLHFSSHDVADRFDCALVDLKERMDKMLDNHTLYLAHLREAQEGLPIVSNAFALEMMHIIYDYKWQAIMR